MTYAKKGTWVAPGQPPIIVTEDGAFPDGMHGPWVKYRFPWEKDEEARPVLWTAFSELVEAVGYAHQSDKK